MSRWRGGRAGASNELVRNNAWSRTRTPHAYHGNIVSLWWTTEPKLRFWNTYGRHGLRYHISCVAVCIPSLNLGLRTALRGCSHRRGSTRDLMSLRDRGGEVFENGGEVCHCQNNLLSWLRSKYTLNKRSLARESKFCGLTASGTKELWSHNMWRWSLKA